MGSTYCTYIYYLKPCGGLTSASCLLLSQSLSASLTRQEEKERQQAQGLRGSEEITFQLLPQAKQTQFRGKIFNWLPIKLVFSSEKHKQEFNASFPHLQITITDFVWWILMKWIFKSDFPNPSPPRTTIITGRFQNNHDIHTSQYEILLRCVFQLNLTFL